MGVPERPHTEEVAAEAEPMDTHHPSQPRSASTTQAGEEALGRGAWEEARVCFEAALKDEETPEALEGLGGAAEALQDAGRVFRGFLDGKLSRERAIEAACYAAYGTFEPDEGIGKIGMVVEDLRYLLAADKERATP